MWLKETILVVTVFVSEIFGTKIKSKKSEHVWRSAFAKKQIFPEKNLQKYNAFFILQSCEPFRDTRHFWKKFSVHKKVRETLRFFDPPPWLIYYVWVNSPEKTVVKSFFYHNLEHRPLILLILCFLGAGKLFNFF